MALLAVALPAVELAMAEAVAVAMVSTVATVSVEQSLEQAVAASASLVGSQVTSRVTALVAALVTALVTALATAFHHKLCRPCATRQLAPILAELPGRARWMVSTRVTTRRLGATCLPCASLARPRQLGGESLRVRNWKQPSMGTGRPRSRTCPCDGIRSPLPSSERRARRQSSNHRRRPIRRAISNHAL